MGICREGYAPHQGFGEALFAIGSNIDTLTEVAMAAEGAISLLHSRGVQELHKGFALGSFIRFDLWESFTAEQLATLIDAMIQTIPYFVHPYMNLCLAELLVELAPDGRTLDALVSFSQTRPTVAAMMPSATYQLVRNCNDTETKERAEAFVRSLMQSDDESVRYEARLYLRRLESL